MESVGKFPPIRFIVYRGRHHAARSGYARVAEFGPQVFPGSLVLRGKPFPRWLIPNRLMWRIADGVIPYDRESLASELLIARQMLKDRGAIFHLLYGEHTFHYISRLNNFRQNRVVVTFHHPPSTLRNNVQVDWHIRKAAGIVVVGTSQIDYFSALVGRERVFFAPLGVDLEYYTPPLFEERSSTLCLFVGRHLRDLPSLRGVIELVSVKRPDVEFVAVVGQEGAEYLGVHPNLKIMHNISEQALLELYRKAAVMVMPLLDATANNTLLEGMACGAPTLVTDVGSTCDYVNEQCAVLTPLYDSRKMAQELLELLDDPGRRQQLSERGRQHMLQFSWLEVVRKLGPIYQAIDQLSS